MRDFFQRRRRTIALLCGLAAAFVLLSYNLQRPPGEASTGPVDSLLFRLTAPFQRSAAVIAASWGLLWDDYLHLVRVREKNELLEEKVARLEARVAALQEKAGATERLVELLQFRETNPWRVAVVRVVGLDAGGVFRTVTLDKGLADDLGPDMPVVTAKGVVGRVVRLHPTTCQALLLTDMNSAIDAVVQRTRDRGIVAGTGAGRCELRYAERQSDIRVGDVVLTSGLTGDFPAGLVLGEVESVEKEGPGLFQSISVRPAVQVDRLEEALVILGERP